MNLFELFARITLDTDDYEKKIGDASSKTDSFASKLGSGLASAAKAGAVALTAVSAAAATGVAALTKAAVENYGEYEQLVGGVETLFKQSSEAVVGYAENAYKTAGMSSNEYMETVTSFSASLLQSLGGDTDKAAEKADLAITDMADNANKMGSSMESIQNAYSGFAKQNYTMLDNLKLGYGGTKEEMERLLADAQKISGIKYDISSYSDIVDAIHVVQTEMGITGTTALEAGTTIQGSISSMKAAWTNLITGLADGNADIESLVGDLVTTLTGDGTETNLGVIGTVIPAVKTALSGVARLVRELAPRIIAEIPPLIAEILPGLVEGVEEIVSALGDALPALITTLSVLISEQAPMLMEAGLNLLLVLGNSMVENAPLLIETVVALIENLSTWLIENAPMLMESAITLITTLAGAMAENLPTLIPVMVDAILQLCTTLTDPEQIGNLVDAAITIIAALADGLLEALPTLIEQAPVIVENLVVALVENIPKMIAAAAKMILGLVTGVIENLPKIGEAAGKIVTTLVTGITNLKNKIKEVGANIVAGVWNGISEKVTWFTNKVKGFFSGIVSGVKSVLGIKSPSKVFAGIGGYMAEGLGQGWDSEFSSVKKDITEGLDFGVAHIGVESSAMGMSAAGLSQRISESLSVIGEGATIVVQSILDGKVIGESAYQYSRNKLKAYGG